MSATARQLIQLGLAADLRQSATGSDHALVAMSALVAAEHAVVMVASVLPDGERLMQELAVRAASAAEERIAMFRQVDT